VGFTNAGNLKDGRKVIIFFVYPEKKHYFTFQNGNWLQQNHNRDNNSFYLILPPKKSFVEPFLIHTQNSEPNALLE